MDSSICPVISGVITATRGAIGTGAELHDVATIAFEWFVVSGGIFAVEMAARNGFSRRSISALALSHYLLSLILLILVLLLPWLVADLLYLRPGVVTPVFHRHAATERNWGETICPKDQMWAFTARKRNGASTLTLNIPPREGTVGVAI